MRKLSYIILLHDLFIFTSARCFGFPSLKSTKSHKIIKNVLELDLPDDVNQFFPQSRHSISPFQNHSSVHDVQRSLILEFDVVYLIGRLTIHLYLENDLPPWLSSPRYLEAHLIFLSIFVCHLFL